MTLWCNACQCYVRTPCTSHHLSEDQRPSSFCRRFRSTKGASKARRDQINNEIRNMRALLPITSDDQERLSYLHSMAVICTHIKKSVLFQGLTSKEESECSVPYEAFLQALHGFILVTTAQGRLVCVSENVVEYLGISLVDVLQGDSLYDMVERSDIDVVKSNLDFDSNSSPERIFVCSMQTSKAFKLQNGGCGSMLVRGSFQFFPLRSGAPSSASSSSSRPVAEPLFVAVCTPTVDRLRTDNSLFCHSFSSLHRLDMSFSQVSDSVLYYLGHSSEELTSRSWYSLIHPEDLSPSAECHKTLVQSDDGYQLQMVLRLQCSDLSWTWIYIRANKEPQSISCTNYIISETEARFLQQKINSEAFGLADSCHSSSNHKASKCLKRQRTSSSQGDEPCARPKRRRRDSWQDRAFVACDLNQEDRSSGSKCESPNMFTPPYTPTSSSSSFGHDLLMDVLSSPEASPSYFTFPTAPSTCAQSPSQSPVSFPPAQPFDRASLNAFPAQSPPLSSSSSLSPSYDDFAACTSDARLVPDCLSVSCESPAECTLHQDDLMLSDQPQGGGVVPHDHALHPSLLTPTQSPTSQGTFEYSEREREEISVLAQQISSLANSFDMFRTLSPVQNAQTSQLSPCAFPDLAPLTFKSEPILDDCIFDSILNDLDLVTIKSTSRSTSCQMQQQQQPLTPLGASANIREPADQLTSGRMSVDQNNGLHQLNHYIHSSLQQDGLAEENLY